jgi:hypothetical protein
MLNIKTGTRHLSPASGYRHSPALTIRWATDADAPGLRILAELDEAPVPQAPLLLAFVGDELWLALSLTGGEMISDPFRSGAEVAPLLIERARQLVVPEPPRFSVRRFARALARHEHVVAG